MDIRCPRCGCEAVPAGHEDARAYYQCPKCNRIWATTLASLSGPEGPRSRRGSIRVLVVDDSNELTGLVAAWLEEEGYAVITATSGREALDAASVYYPDIVLLDLIMPPPDGFAVCAALRTPLPPQVILMTGLSDADHVRRALDLGVVALLRKPLTREAVVDAVTVAAERSNRDPLSKLRWHFGMHPRA
jgi:DNA-binding response OmpR family regulator